MHKIYHTPVNDIPGCTHHTRFPKKWDHTVNTFYVHVSVIEEYYLIVYVIALDLYPHIQYVQSVQYLLERLPLLISVHGMNSTVTWYKYVIVDFFSGFHFHDPTLPAPTSLYRTVSIENFEKRKRALVVSSKIFRFIILSIVLSA